MTAAWKQKPTIVVASGAPRGGGGLGGEAPAGHHSRAHRHRGVFCRSAATDAAAADDDEDGEDGE